MVQICLLSSVPHLLGQDMGRGSGRSPASLTVPQSSLPFGPQGILTLPFLSGPREDGPPISCAPYQAPTHILPST